MDLQTPLTELPGIGPSYSRRLSKLNINTVEDLINHYPFRYDDYSKISPIVGVKIGDQVTLKGEVWQIKNSYTKFGKVITKAILNDGTGSIELTWFNQSYLTKVIKEGNSLHAAGKITTFAGKPTIITPDWEKWDRSIHTGRLVPIYPETAGVSSKYLRTLISKIFPALKNQIEEFLPKSIKNGLLDLSPAIERIHFPKNWQDVAQARDRLAFNELFLVQLATQQARFLWSHKPVVKAWKVDQKMIKDFTHRFKFELTAAQKRVISEITTDLQGQHPMNRLLQGEVGSGKTVVAAIAIYLAQLNGFKSLFMAPTEILAWQHYQTLKTYLEPLNISVGLYTGSRKFTKDKAAKPDVIIGTHALLSEKIKPENVGLVIVDEQHRFGVEQRALLRQKGAAPHLLTMTATPIPRTVALTVYGDLDLSIIDELPKGRQVVETHLVPEGKRADAYKFITDKVKAGDQAFIITPLIEESETLTSTKAAKAEFEKLKQVFTNIKVGLLHGRMKSAEKESVINDFKNNQVQILVSTSVVEVGMDIPNATIMLIEGAERFGLAQLHQLRGRIGRGNKKSYCLLFTDAQTEGEIRRLKYLEHTFDGLKLAELDLKIRGGGQIFGSAQHGRLDFFFASLKDLELIEKTKSQAAKILQEDPKLDNYPKLRAKLAFSTGAVAPD